MTKRVLFREPLDVGYEEFDLGAPGPSEVLARSLISGISHGTEMTGYLGTTPFVDNKLVAERIFLPKDEADPSLYPFRPGYDMVGEVTAVGADVTRFKVGDRIWFPIHHQSEFLFAEDHHEALLLSDNVPGESAIMLNLLAVALCATNDAEIKLGDVVGVFGGGVVGQLVARMAQLSGARAVFLSDPLAERRDFAAAGGMLPLDPTAEKPALSIQRQNGGESPDVVIECSGTIAGLQSAVQAAGLAGIVIAAGFYAGPATALSMGQEFLHNRVTIKASMHVWGCPSRHAPRWNRERYKREALHLLAAEKIDLSGFVATRFPFERAGQAYEAIRQAPSQHLKVVLEY